MNQQKIEEFTKLQHEVLELNQQLQAKTAEYKALMKAEVGICDGEQTSVLDLVKFVSGLASKAASHARDEWLSAMQAAGEAHVKALLEVKEELAKAMLQSQKETEAVIVADVVESVVVDAAPAVSEDASK